MKRSTLEATLEGQLKILGAPAPVLEHRFHAKRMWRFDMAWPDRMLAVEIEGGVWTNGRHTRGAGFTEDLEKHNAAVLAGWRLFRYAGSHVVSWAAAQEIAEVLKAAA